MSKNKKKPTNKEIVHVINTLIQDVEYMHHQIMSLTAILDIFVEFSGNEEEFKAYAQKKMKERLNQTKERDNDVSGNEQTDKKDIK